MGSIEKKWWPGGLKKSSDRVERTNCQAARRLKFSILREIKQDISDTYNLSISSIWGTLHKHGLFSRKGKGKPLISLKNGNQWQNWARSLFKWPSSHWEDVIFSDECRFSHLNDSGIQRVWRPKQGLTIRCFTIQQCPIHYRRSPRCMRMKSRLWLLHRNFKEKPESKRRNDWWILISYINFLERQCSSLLIKKTKIDLQDE